MRRSFLAVLTGLLLVQTPVLLHAQDRDAVSVSEKTKFILNIDIGAFKKTKLGGKLFELAKKQAVHELHDGDEDHAAKMKETLGFDPFTEVEGITVVGSEFENPEDNVQVMLRMRKTTGNLEGLAATLPGYSSSEHRKHTIHSASPDGDGTVHAAIHTDRNGTKRVLMARSAESVRGMLDRLDGKARASRSVRLPRKKGTFVHLQLLALPERQLGEWPQANMAKMVQGFSLVVGEADGDVSMTLTVNAKEEKQAEQIQQMVQGLVAMVQLAQEDDDDLKRAQKILQHLEVKRDGTEVRLQLSVPEQQVLDLLHDQMNLTI